MSSLATLPGLAELPAKCAGRVGIADGNPYFNRPGLRFVASAGITATAIHPARLSGLFNISPDALAQLTTG